MATYNGYYGNNTPCTIFTYTVRNGLTWYCVEDSGNVNATYDIIEDGVNVELLKDVDFFTWSSKIETEEELMKAVEG